MIVLAKAIKGQEFLYNRESVHEVSKASADLICKALNEAKYNLKDNEVWHKYTDFCQYSGGWEYATCQKFTRFKGHIRERKNFYSWR